MRHVVGKVPSTRRHSPAFRLSQVTLVPLESHVRSAASRKCVMGAPPVRRRNGSRVEMLPGARAVLHLWRKDSVWRPLAERRRGPARGSHCIRASSAHPGYLALFSLPWAKSEESKPWGVYILHSVPILFGLWTI